jgi:hypothetical protein
MCARKLTQTAAQAEAAATRGNGPCYRSFLVGEEVFICTQPIGHKTKPSNGKVTGEKHQFSDAELAALQAKSTKVK